jgi:hypothetical protein
LQFFELFSKLTVRFCQFIILSLVNHLVCIKLLDNFADEIYVTTLTNF